MIGGGEVEEKLYTIAEIAQKAGVPESTARRYSNLFGDFLPNKNFGRVTKYKIEAVAIIQRVAALYQEGRNTQEIENLLSLENPRVVDVVEDGESLPATVLPQIILPMLAMQLQVNQQLMEEIAEVKKELAEIRTEQRLYDEASTIRDIQTQKCIKELKEWATVKLEEKTKKPWWKKIFS